MVMIREVPNGGWQAFTDWGGQLGGTWTREEAARAVSELPVPSTKKLLEEVEYWKSRHRELVKTIRDSGVAMDPGYDRTIGAAMWYHDGGGMASSPLDMLALRTAIRTHRKASNNE